ncbi:uncharacterized protein [Rutidosis leptorrhynchoides]|uniref:uncharacterized protein n=1 Tax=Rutidosis leptorrhynchoides TaxID=125765 RepID=UPI003A991F7A
MAPYSIMSICIVLTISLHFQETRSAINYQVINEATTTTGGIKFMEKLGISGAKQMMAEVNNFIWNTVLEQTNPVDRLTYNTLELVIKPDIVGADGIAYGNKINVSAIFFARVPDVKLGFKHLMCHEMTHSFQWTGEGRTPPMLVEGIADYTTLRAKTVDRALFEKPGQGDRWDQGYHITALFLEYCDTVTPSFTAKLNKMMRKTYDVTFFQNITGKPVEQLWKDYKSNYGQHK